MDSEPRYRATFRVVFPDAELPAYLTPRKREHARKASARFSLGRVFDAYVRRSIASKAGTVPEEWALFAFKLGSTDFPETAPDGTVWGIKRILHRVGGW